MKYLEKSQQNPEELAQFIKILNDENVLSYLEIGSHWGGSLWRIANALPKGSLIVSVDFPNALWGTDSGNDLRHCVDNLCTLGYDAHVYFGDSLSSETVKWVQQFGKFDACFIDGNHKRKYVEADFRNYGSLARIVAFHDISWKPRPWKKTEVMDAPQVWNEIKVNYKYKEIKLEERDDGIGVLWRC